MSTEVCITLYSKSLFIYVPVLFMWSFVIYITYVNTQRKQTSASPTGYRFRLPLTWRESHFQDQDLRPEEWCRSMQGLDPTVTVKSSEGVIPCVAISSGQMSFLRLSKSSPKIVTTQKMSPVNSWARCIHVFFVICNLFSVMESKSE